MSPFPTLLCVLPHWPPPRPRAHHVPSYLRKTPPGPISQVLSSTLGSQLLSPPPRGFSDQIFQVNALYLFPSLKKTKKSKTPPRHISHHVTIFFTFTVQPRLPLQIMSTTGELRAQCLAYSKCLISMRSSEGQRPAQTHSHVIHVPVCVTVHLGGYVRRVNERTGEGMSSPCLYRSRLTSNCQLPGKLPQASLQLTPTPGSPPD